MSRRTRTAARFPSKRQLATERLRWVIFSIRLARAKEAVGDVGGYARFDWRRAWEYLALREGLS